MARRFVLPIAAAAAAFVLAAPADAGQSADQILAALERQAGSNSGSVRAGTTRGGRIILDDAVATEVTGQVEVSRNEPAGPTAADGSAIPVAFGEPPVVDRADQVNLSVTFETNSAFIRPSAAEDLTEACTAFSQISSDLRLNIIGHTDAAGSLDHNRTLSAARARSVARHFVKNCGVDAGQLIVWGAGESRLLPDLPPVSEGQRRVEVSVATNS